MHFEVPKAKTFKEFGGEYLMIVISILTALGLEAVVEQVHHRHLAHDASARMNVELRANIDSVKRTIANNDKNEKALRTIREQMMADLRAHVGDQAFLDRYRREWKGSVVMSLQTPSLAREAWETAVANQAVTWLPPAQLEKYATSYAAIRDSAALFNGGAMNFLDAPRMLDVFSDVYIGAGNPRDIFHTVTQMITSYSSFDGNLQNLQKQLETATAELEKLEHR